MRYTSKTKKEDILKIIIDEFEATQEAYTKAKEEGWQLGMDRADGRYFALTNIMREIGIYEHE